MSCTCPLGMVVVVLCAVSNAPGDIVHVDPEPDFSAGLTPAAMYETKDVDIDLVPTDETKFDDLTFRLYKSTTIGTTRTYVETVGDVSVDALGDEAINHSYGDVIGGGLSFSSDATLTGYYAESRPDLPNQWFYGDFGTGYLGLEIKDSTGNSYYGWAHVTANLAPELTVHEWAYESQPGLPIAAGAVPEPTMVLLLAVSGLAMLRRRKR